jgi:phage portal protein BeeE
MLSNGWLPAGSGWNWWQTGANLQPYGEHRAMVEACVGAYSQTVAMCTPGHWIKLDNGGRDQVSNSALSRIVKHPNDYQSISDFFLNLTRRLYERGEAFAIAVRNNRSEIVELHLMREGRAMKSREKDRSSIRSTQRGDLSTHRSGGGDLARDVLHVRLHTTSSLRGESPILSAVLDLAMSGAALNQRDRVLSEPSPTRFHLVIGRN